MRSKIQTLLVTIAAAPAHAAVPLRAQTGGAGPVRGDVDGDGKVTAADARIIADYLVGRPAPAGVDVAERGDVNGDGRVTSVDAAIISAYVAGRDMSRYGIGKPEELPANALQKLTCRGDVRARTLSCDDPQLPAGIRALNMGGQNVNVKLTSSNLSYNSGTGAFTFDVTVKNLIPQTLGTTDGTTSDPDSVRVFFGQQPTATSGPGSITITNATGSAMFTASNQPYFEYPGPLATNATSPARNWHFDVPNTVNTFSFTVYVAGAVQYPNGWVDVYPPQHAPSPYNVYADTLAAGQTLQLTDSVRNPVGHTVSGATVTWGATSHGAATVNASGLVTAVADGVDTVTATSGGRVGKVAIVVSTASAAKSTITAVPTSIQAGDSSTITVQIKDAGGNNYTKSAGTVALADTAGTLTPVTDNNNGTYTAKYTYTRSGTYRISGTLNGTAIGDSATVTVTAGAPDSLFVHAANPQTGTAGLPAGSPPGVLVTDKYHNPVQGVTIRFGVTSGGGKLSNGGPASDSVDVVTGSNGIATVTSWTLGNTAGTSNNTVVAHPTAVTLLPASVTFTASADPGPPANMVKSAGDGQSATVNTNVSTAPAVTITDSHGNTVPGVVVHFAVASGGGSVGAPDSSTTNASGVATATSWKLGTTAGSNTLTASHTGLTTVTFSATGTADVPASITKTSTDPQNGAAGSAVASAPAVHVVDQYGNAVPGATITFSVAGGGGSTTAATPTTDASGNATVGSWTLGSGPATNTLSASATPAGTSSPVTFTAYIPPTVGTDSSQAMGNTTLASNIAPNVLSNDATINGGSVSLAPSSIGALTTVRGGTVTMASNGTFSYLPAAGVTGRDSVQYTIQDSHYTGPATSAGYIKFRFVGKVWYIDSSGSNGDGRDVTPFSSVANAEASAGTNDTMLVRTGGATTGGGTLKNGQIVRGQGHNAAFTTTLNGNSVTLLGTGTAPNVGSLALASGNSLRGIRVFSASGGGLTGTSVGTLSVGEISVGVTGGPAIDIASGTLTGNGGSGTAVFDSVRSDNSTTTGIAFSGISGTVTINGGTASRVSNPVGTAFSANGSNTTVTFPGTISKTNGAGTGISLTSNGGSFTFSGPSIVLNTGSGTGINMSSVSGTVSFVDSVKVTTTSGAGISASTGGTLTIAGTHNSISSGTGTALSVSSTTIGAGGLNFRSISASGGSNGIFLSSTGTSGGLTVTGDGSTNGSGGTISNTTGADGASAGNGVYLSSAQNVSLSWMALSGHQNHAVYGTSAKNVDLNHVRITGNNGTSNSGTFQEGAVHFVNATGGITVKNSRLDGSAYTAFLVEQLAGSPAADSVVAAFDTVSTGQGSTSDVRGQALQTIVTSGSANVRYRNNSVTYWWGTGIEVAVQNTAGTSTAIIQNNKVNQTSGALAAAGGIEVSGGALSFNISGNNITGADGTAISVDRAQGNTVLNGTIDSNTIGTSGVTNSGSATGTGIFVQHAGPSSTTVKVTNNTIRQINGTQAIWFLLGDDSGGGGVGTMNVTATGNNIAEEGSAASARTGIVVQSGRVTGDTDTMCADVQSNSITNFNNRIRPNERFLTTMRVRGYTGATNDNTAMNNYLTSLNPGTVNVSSNDVSAGGPGFLNTSPAGSACPQPSM